MDNRTELTQGMSEEAPPKEPLHEKLFELAQALDYPGLPLSLRAEYVKRELALLCKELMAQETA